MKMKLTLFAVVILATMMMVACKAPKETSVLKIYQGNTLVESVTGEDFLAVFTKNNLSEEKLTKESIEEYLDLFINYKLKVKEAEALGMDTLSGFRSELQGYREQLARPYLTDQEVTEKQVQEAWERMQYDVRASHILVTLPREATPADTLNAYKKISEARSKLLGGADFYSVAAEYSDDPYAKDIPPSETSPGRKGNGGDLGYFTVFDMVYPFESAAFNTPVGEVSPVTRSAFGYHILKVTDRKPAMGRVFLAHVYVPFPRSAEPTDSAAAIRKINDIHAEYLKGETSFEDLAKNYSEDRNNAQNGGVLRWFNAHGLVPEFVAAVSEMEVDEVSAPIRTMYGWHIIKLLNRERPESLEKELPNIRQRIAKDVRAQMSRDRAVEKIKEANGYKEYPANIEKVAKYVDSSIFNGTWIPAKSGILKNKKPLIKIGDETITVARYGEWLETRQSRSGTGDMKFLLSERFKEFSNEMVLSYKEKRLEQLYPEFRALMKEYRDGILLFDLMDKKVWSFAVQDTAGLQDFYNQHKHNHKWDKRVDASVYIFKTADAASKARNYLFAGMSEQEILDTINAGSALELTLKHDKYQAGDNPLVDAHPWTVGITEVKPLTEGTQGYPGFYFIHYKEILPPGVKQLSEVRGLMISQYQEQLEKDWLEHLKAKYRVEIIRPELEKLYQ